MDRLLNVMTVLSVTLIILVLVSVRRAHIRVEYSVSWLVAAVGLLVLSRNRTLLHWLSHGMGLGADAPLALLLLVFCLFAVVFYTFSLQISDLKDRNIALTQRLAILEFELRAQREGQS